MNDAQALGDQLREWFEGVREAGSRRSDVPPPLEIVSIESEQVPRAFPEGLTESRATVLLEVPVIFSVRNSRADEASHDNLNRLRQATERFCAADGRLELIEWAVSPGENPKPDASDPNQTWTVSAVFRLP